MEHTNRKFQLTVAVAIGLTAMFVLPAVTTLVLGLLGHRVQFQLLSPELYMGFMITLWTTFFGANVTSKHRVFQPQFEAQKCQEPVTITNVSINPVDNSGGQPYGSDNV